MYINCNLVSDPNAKDHTITIKVIGTTPGFSVTTTRVNPANTGAVTGKVTYGSFYKSVEIAVKTSGIHDFQLC
jgi:hypothetical protein